MQTHSSGKIGKRCWWLVTIVSIWNKSRGCFLGTVYVCDSRRYTYPSCALARLYSWVSRVTSYGIWSGLNAKAQHCRGSETFIDLTEDSVPHSAMVHAETVGNVSWFRRLARSWPWDVVPTEAQEHGGSSQLLPPPVIQPGSLKSNMLLIQYSSKSIYINEYLVLLYLYNDKLASKIYIYSKSSRDVRHVWFPLL